MVREKIDEIVKKSKTKLETAINYKRAHNSHWAARLKLVTFELFLVSSLKLFRKDMEWSKKDLWDADVLLKVTLMLLLAFASGVVAMDHFANRCGTLLIWNSLLSNKDDK